VADAADPGVRAVKNVLIICHANTARSVMAHVLLERMLTERETAGHIRIRSGGIANYARDGMLPSLDARIVLREEGIHLGEDGLVSTDLKRHRYLLAEADLILTMTTAQKEMLAAFPEATGRPTYTLREFAGAPGDIDDPAMQGEDVFRACREAIKSCLDATADRLLTLFPSQRSTEKI
jgi:protein-tyrosine phosphatase